MLRFYFFSTYFIQIIWAVQINIIQKPPTNYAVSPSWDAKSQSLFFVDFITTSEQPDIYRFDYKTGQTFRGNVIGESRVSLIVPVEGCDDEYIVGVDDGLKVVRWNGVSPTATVIRTLYNTGERLNFPFVDPKGRVFSGTLNDAIFCSAPANYSMYRYSKENGLQLIFNQVKSNTGFAIDEKLGIFYHIDACQSRIVAFDYDLKTGDICNGRVVFDFESVDMGKVHILLGMDIDSQGNLYVGLYLESSIAVINPRTSTLLQTISLPAKGVSGVAFGGPNMDELFVTSGTTLVNPLFGGIQEIKPDDPTLYTISGLGTHGIEGRRAVV